MNEFDKIIGYEKEKEELKQICDILKRRQEYANLGVKPPKGILFEGVPGVGKTLMAWSLIKESGLKLFHCKKDKHDGEFIETIRETFENAKKEAPSIIFLDDVDKFAAHSSDRSSNQAEFVSIQTGMEEIKNSDVIVVATANDIGYLPQSLRRNGRFDKIINVELPDIKSMIKIVNHYLSSKAIDTDVSGESIVRMMNGCSCADLETVLNEAGIYAGYERLSKIKQEHFTRAIARINLNINLYDLPEYSEKLKKAAYHEAGHVVMSLFCKSLQPSMSSICMCGDKLGVTRYYFTNNAQSQYEETAERIMCGLGGRVAEEIFFNDKIIGTKSDIEKIYASLEEMVTTQCVFGYEYNCFRDTWDTRISPKRMDNIENKISELFEEFYAMTKEKLSKNKPLISKVANMLLDKKLLSIKDFENL